MTPFHLRVLRDAEPACRRFGLFLAGGYAMKAHGLTDRPSQDLDFATACEIPLPEVAAEVAEEFRRAGYEVRIIEVTPRMGRMTVTDPISGQAVEFDLLREALQDRPLFTDLCPVIGLDDAVALKMRALHGRGLPRDFIDVASVAHMYPYRELERLCALHDEEFSVGELLLRLDSIEHHPDEAYEAYGLGADDIRRIRLFALAWADDIRLRRVEDGDSAIDYLELDEEV
ncbi:nucleotidyl transferase AbiEii/AbiGii toxin family protein [Thermopolyspora sp. NPDC052614]|uniref:nucleotidyl transferase AbiEii/AbiGii toxin family protein n=1 Tax=Thermopolyspora sp. NPDC052614 TaxID=3155682 RepID=UPI003422C0D1